jgi:NAD(P)H-hydrate repair Nnr-like enzyme with NAD(P)H-hydrate dehydratase domain
MDLFEYWSKQTPENPLFPDVEWSKPQQKSRAGKLAIIGGNAHGFAAVAAAHAEALDVGVGSSKVVLPDALKKSIPDGVLDALFVPTNHSGGMGKGSEELLLGAATWADGVLLIGDTGRNSETAVALESLLVKYNGPLTITRDAIDLLKNNSKAMIDRPDTLVVASFAQLQKIFQAVYYPKTLLFSMQLMAVVEALHKFTTTYPVHIMVLHGEHLVVASGGDVSTTPWQNPMAIWRGSVATKATAYWLWNQKQPFKALTTSIIAN